MGVVVWEWKVLKKQAKWKVTLKVMLRVLNIKV